MSELSDSQWQLAHIIARSLVQDGMDVNELKKTMAYLRTCVDEVNGGDRFFNYLKTLVRNGSRIGHSKKTAGYYSSLDETCVKYLKPLQDTPQMMLEILSWAARLVAYYKEAPLGELLNASMEVSVVSVEQEKRQTAIAQVMTQNTFTIAQKLEARVMKISGNKVTYEILGAIRLTEKEPKKAGALSEGQVVTVAVVALKEDGSIKSVKYER